ncbi:MAG: hypothetical protein EOO88_39580 [Pedobacter sp.]|nr:MAG: hypothetical protein EOO88_39580 [Pedobacter sp.]
MGILDSGPLGPFRKKIGPGIGRRHMGQNLVLPLYHKSTTPATEAQLLQRKKFGMLRSFLSPVRMLVNPGFKAFVKKNSPANAAFSHNFDHAFVMNGDVPEINYPRIMFSRGQITTPNGLQVSSAAGFITFSWLNEPQSRYCQSTDKASFVIYHPAKGTFRILLDQVDRKALHFETAVSSGHQGESVHCWIVFASANGRVRGDSKYGGIIQIPGLI